MQRSNKYHVRFFFIIALFILLASYFPHTVFARGGCFAGDVRIATPNGSVPIKDLRSGDQVISYNQSTNRNEVSTVRMISIFTEPIYYRINQTIKVTPTHPFYVFRNGKFDIVEVKDLRQGDLLFTVDHQLIPVTSIEMHREQLMVYNLEDVSPNNSYFVNGVLVHNKGGGGGGGGGGGHGGSSSSPYYYNGMYYNSSALCDTIKDANAKQKCKEHFSPHIGFGIVVFFFYIIITIIIIANSFGKVNKYFKRGKQFTTNDELIAYVRTVVPNFTNIYDGYYSTDTERWEPMVPPPAVSPALYQNLASKDVLREQVQKLYERYEQDWTTKNFEAMQDYVIEPYYSKQKQIFDTSFGNNYDVVYNPNILSATPLKVDLTIKGEWVKLQVNGEMSNFEVSPTGTVMSGEPQVRQFTEYWDVFIDLNKKKMYLGGIEN